MTEWTNLQYFAVGTGVVSGLGSLGWVVTQGRKLHREERARAKLEAAALAVIDMLREQGATGSRSCVISRADREAAALAARWGAISIRWHNGEMYVRLANLDDPRE